MNDNRTVTRSLSPAHYYLSGAVILPCFVVVFIIILESAKTGQACTILGSMINNNSHQTVHLHNK